MPKSLKLIGLLAVSAFALTACGSDNEAAEVETNASTESPAQSPASDQESFEQVAPEDDPGFGHGEYAFMSEQSSEITFELPTSADHELLTGIEEFRETAGAEPVTYIVADIDNRYGNQDVNLQNITAYDFDGNAYEFGPVSPIVDGWQPYWDADGDYIAHDGEQIDEATYDELRAQGGEVEDELESSVDVSAQDELVLVYEGTDLPDAFTRVSADPHALGEQDVYPAE